MTELKNKSEPLDYSQSKAKDGTVADQSHNVFSFELDTDEDGQRLDKILSVHFPTVSRSRIKELIDNGNVLVSGSICEKASQKGLVGQKISIEIIPRVQEMEYQAQSMPINVVFEDEAILVINKPAGLVVHPAAGHWNDTLLNGLLAYDEIFKQLPRAGIVHRLDKDTSGLMVVAKTEQVQLELVHQLQNRSVKREYWAIVRGISPEAKLIDAPIERDSRNPLRFMIGRSSRAKPAITDIRKIDQKVFNGKTYSWIAARLQTGRTHQIRLHMESLGLPLVGDPLYRNKLPFPTDDGTVVNSFGRQALHACRLGLIHPVSGQMLEWFAAPPEDFQNLMRELDFGPGDKPVEIFGESMVIDRSSTTPPIKKITSWDDFDFGDESEDDQI